ncbi:uncharacterized protein LOC131625023 [Vicia villosa]|uniref:uncharacterized protein LOC131625023 n=1 Tax=Vicia villosa TaxID=3911 RepID=UPI00273BE15D|nr:uncharacterized protein LOC131625023 [Vicia villosa]
MEGENSVYYKDYEQVGDVLLKPSVTESMFTSWFEANITYEEARLLTYGDFVSKFVYHKRSRSWKPRKRGYTIGRLIWVLQSTGGLFYLRMMFTVKKDPLCYDDIKMVDGQQHKTFRGACFAMGFLQDDREFVEAIKEAHVWGSGDQDEQRTIYEEIMDVVQKQRGGVFFYMAMVELVKIPVPTLETSICNINKKDDLAELLKMTDLIIWDESPMANKFCFESLDKSLKDIMSGMPHASHKIFGGKVVVFGGDFRQILPVIPRGTRSDIIHATINSSYIWDHYKVLKLTKNMRLQSGATTSTTNDIRSFSEWNLNIGDGTVCEPNDGYADICIPDEFLISNFSDPLKAIVEDTYPDLIHNYLDSNYLQSRAILASTIEVVDDINQYIKNLLPVVLGEDKEYFSSDSIDKSDATKFDAYEHVTPEFLNALKTSRFPNHSIRLKVGVTVQASTTF